MLLIAYILFSSELSLCISFRKTLTFILYFVISIQFFPKTEKYVSLYVGGDEAEIMEKRNTLHKQIKDNLIAAAASGKELEGTFFC